MEPEKNSFLNPQGPAGSDNGSGNQDNPNIDTNDFREYLKQEFLRRSKRNPRYSLRAFGASLGTSHALLSLLINGKRKMTTNHVMKLGKALNLPIVDLDRFISHLGSISYPIKKSPEIQALSIDAFHSISEWYHDAILELSRLSDFDGSPKTVAHMLGITYSEAMDAIDRLSRLGLIEMQPDGRWVEAKTSTTIESSDTTSEALRAHQRQVLALSADAVLNVPKTARDHTCITIAVRSRDLEELKNRIKIFRRAIMAYAQRDLPESEVPYDDVYNVSISLFPMTKLHQKRGKVS